MQRHNRRHRKRQIKYMSHTRRQKYLDKETDKIKEKN